MHSDWTARRYGCVFAIFLDVFCWLALTSRVRPDLALFWDCDFCGLFFEPLYDSCTALQSLQSQDEQPGREDFTRWPQGHPPSDLSKERKEIFLYLALGAGRFLPSWIFTFLTFFFTSS